MIFLNYLVYYVIYALMSAAIVAWLGGPSTYFVHCADVPGTAGITFEELLNQALSPLNTTNWVEGVSEHLFPERDLSSQTKVLSFFENLRLNHLDGYTRSFRETHPKFCESLMINKFLALMSVDRESLLYDEPLLNFLMIILDLHREEVLSLTSANPFLMDRTADHILFGLKKALLADNDIYFHATSEELEDRGLFTEDQAREYKRFRSFINKLPEDSWLLNVDSPVADNYRKNVVDRENYEYEFKYPGHALNPAFKPDGSINRLVLKK